ncbi:MAG: hypothetical protein ACKOTB_12480 [Planctomycetia bacterium]
MKHPIHRGPTAMLRLFAAVVLVSIGPSARGDELAAALEPHVGRPLDLVELATGKRFVRPVLEKIATRDEKTTAVTLRAEEGGRTVTVPVTGIARISPAGKRSTSPAPLQAARAAVRTAARTSG